MKGLRIEPVISGTQPMSTDLREGLYTLAEQLPDNATWEEALERLRFR